jgi:hypothetical protein
MVASKSLILPKESEMKKTMVFLMALSLVFIFSSICYADSYETEPNNDKTQADALTSGSPIVGQNGTYDDDDWFYVCTSGADVIEVTLESGGVFHKAFWTIYTEDVHGNQLSEYRWDSYSGGMGTESSVQTVVGTSGIYYIKIKSHYSEPYTLTASISNPGECPSEPSQYDLVGIWQVVGQGYYFSFNVSGSDFIVLTFIPGQGEGYMLGYMSGNTGYVTAASDLSQFNATFTATSATAGTLTVNTCVPFSGEHCLLPAGTTVNVAKIF